MAIARPRSVPLAAPAVVLALAWALAGCASGVRLADEESAAPYAALGARARAAPRTVERVLVRAPGSPPVAVAIEAVRSPRGASRPVLVLQPGILADGSTFRFLVGALAGEYDLLVVDPPGSGRSDAPDPSRAGPRAYSPSWLAEHTLLALEDWMRRQPAPRPWVPVGHSLGGTVVLRMLADPDLAARHRDLLSRADRAVLLAPADLAMAEVAPCLVDLAELGDAEARVGAALGILQAEVARCVADNAVHPERDALAQEADRISGLLARDGTRRAQQAMIRRFNPLDASGRRDWAAIRRLADQERAIRVPLLVLWGREDETLPLAAGRGILERLPTARLETLPGVKHSVHQEGVLEVARRVAAFVEEPVPPGP